LGLIHQDCTHKWRMGGVRTCPIMYRSSGRRPAHKVPYRAQQLAPIPGRTANSRCPVNDPLCEPATWGWACEHGVVDDADLLERKMVICHECDAEVPVVDGATHGYVPAVAGCWATFTQLQADELRRWGRAFAHWGGGRQLHGAAPLRRQRPAGASVADPPLGGPVCAA